MRPLVSIRWPERMRAPDGPDRAAGAPPRASGGRGRNRPQAIAESLKEWIMERGLEPGDRLPQEHDLIAALGVAKGTVREALKVLETQGLVRTRTGPGGGAFITSVAEDHAAALMANHFFFENVSIRDIYEMRIVLEPQLVLDLAPGITQEQIALLREKMTFYASPPASIDEERVQRRAELEFHETLASFSGNPLLRFQVAFLARMLKDLTVCRRIYDTPNPELRARGLSYQQQLVEALEARDAETARDVMRAHMRAAQKMMLAREAEVTRAFLTLDGQ